MGDRAGPAEPGLRPGLPLVLLLLLSAIQANIPVSLFEIDRLTPGITVFGLAFAALFSATLVSRDRESALCSGCIPRPLLPGTSSSAICCRCCLWRRCRRPSVTWRRSPGADGVGADDLGGAAGPACGAAVYRPGPAVRQRDERQAGGRHLRALLTNLTAWLSGTWFDLELVGGAFQRIAYALPLCPRRGAGPGGSVRRLGQRHAPPVVGAGLRRRGPGRRRAAVPAADEAAIWIEKTGAGRDARHRFCSNLMQ